MMRLRTAFLTTLTALALVTPARAQAPPPIRFPPTPDFSPDGTRIAYVRGPGSWYRKGYRGSANDEVWLCAADGSGNVRLTHHDGQDGSPMWSADGRTVFYVSDCCGTPGSPANVVRVDP